MCLFRQSQFVLCTDNDQGRALDIAWRNVVPDQQGSSGKYFVANLLKNFTNTADQHFVVCPLWVHRLGNRGRTQSTILSGYDRCTFEGLD